MFGCNCRLFDPKPLLHNFADSHTDSPDTPQTEFTFNKFDEQTRMTRPLFAAFFKEYLPSHPSLQPGSAAHLMRSELLEDIFTYFGTSIRESYHAQKHKVTANLARTNLWTNIRDAIKIAFPDITDQDLHQSIKGLKRDILTTQGQPTPVQTQCLPARLTLRDCAIKVPARRLPLSPRDVLPKNNKSSVIG